jgi:hypothetical protein
MFKVRDAKNELSMEHQLAHFVALSGPLPANFVKGNNMALKYFNIDGECLLTKITNRILERTYKNSQDQP